MTLDKNKGPEATKKMMMHIPELPGSGCEQVSWKRPIRGKDNPVSLGEWPNTAIQNDHFQTTDENQDKPGLSTTTTTTTQTKNNTNDGLFPKTLDYIHYLSRHYLPFHPSIHPSRHTTPHNAKTTLCFVAKRQFLSSSCSTARKQNQEKRATPAVPLALRWFDKKRRKDKTRREHQQQQW